MSFSSKKRKEIDLCDEADVCASENPSEAEIHLEKMGAFVEALRNEIGESTGKSEVLMKALWKEAKELCKTSAFHKSLRAIVDDVVDDDDSSDDEMPIESIADEKYRNWAIMFQQLRDYRIINGHCKVPYRIAENPKLGYWINSQKRQYANTITHTKGLKLKPERIIKLESIGMFWGKKYPPPASWDGMFDNLQTYRDRMGDCNVPFNATNPTALAKWAAYQRMEYKRHKKGLDSLLTLDQIGKLNDLGINWKGPKL
jgi:hypothetical protein